MDVIPVYYLIPMETPTVKKTSKKDYRKLILEGFVNHVLEHGTQPNSVFKFAKELKMKEEEFYTYFTSFEAIKSAIWVSIYDFTLESIESQEVFKEYSAREKFLSFLFTWIEELKKKSFLPVEFVFRQNSIIQISSRRHEGV